MLAELAGTFVSEAQFQSLLEKVDRILADSKPVAANCCEVIAGGSTREEDIICRAQTFEKCVNDDCQMPVCERHEVVCKNCGERFCSVCYQSHVCQGRSPNA